MSLVFISYRREDSAGYAGRLHEALERRFGEGEVFRDVDALEPGQDFVDAIADRLRGCRAALVVIGRGWLNAADAAGQPRLAQHEDYVRLEVAQALSRPELLVIPVLVEGTAMPAPGALPDSIRALSRRHAASLRDETWDADVDRLTATIQKAVGEGVPAPRGGYGGVSATGGTHPFSRSNLKWVAVAAAVVVALLLARAFRQDADRNSAATASGAGAANTASSATGEPASAPARAIALPRLTHIAHGRLIYTILSAAVSPHGSHSTVRLRVRFSNEGRYPANFWDSSFRLAAGGDVLAPTSGLNEVVDGQAARQGVISFEVPADVTRATLQVLGGGEPAVVMLDLTATDAPSTVDQRDTRDPLAGAVIAPLVREPRPLGSQGDITYTLRSAQGRRYVNVLRVIANVQVANGGRYPFLFGGDALRLVADGQSTAPLESANEVVDPGATATADFVFDAPPSVEKIAFRGTARSSELVLDVPAALR